MSGFKAELERTGALEIVREVEGYVCYTRFLETAGEWTISLNDGEAVWKTGLAERDVRDLPASLTDVQKCLESGKMQLSAGSGKISVRLLCSSGTVELNLFALPAVEKRVEMKEVLFLLVKNQQQLRRQLQDCQQQIADIKRQQVATVKDSVPITDMSVKAGGKAQSRPKKPAGHSLVNPSSKRRKAAKGVVFGDDK